MIYPDCKKIPCYTLYLWGVILLAWTPGISTAQPYLKLSQYHQTAWGADNGLPQSTINSIIQDDQGFLWMATAEGLVRFDGLTFSVISRANEPVFQSNDIIALLKDQQGTMWIGTRGGGLLRKRNGQFEPVDSTGEWTGSYITSLYAEEDGGLWVGTYDQGLLSYQKGVFDRYTEEQGLQGSFISTTSKDEDGAIWVGTELGLFKKMGPNFSRILLENTGSHFISALHIDQEQRTWVATREGKLFVRKDNFWHSIEVQGFENMGYILTFLVDLEGNMWFGTDSGGVGRIRFNNEGMPYVEDYLLLEKLAGNPVISLFQDREASIWVGTSGAGVIQMRPGKFRNFSVAEQLSHPKVYSLAEDNEGNVWVGTASGLNKIDRNTVSPAIKGFEGFEILSVYFDKTGGQWIGTYGNGLWYRKNGETLHYTTDGPLPSNNIFALYQDHRDHLWIGTDAGVVAYDGEAFRTIDVEAGLSSNFISAIGEDVQGEIWIATYDAGVNILNGNRIEVLDKSSGLSSDGVLALYRDGEGTMWMGMYGGGLNSIRQGIIDTYTIEDGFFNDNVYVILEDDTGRLWMTCNQGVFSIDKKDLDRHVKGSRDQIPVQVYTRKDGLRSAEGTGGQQPAGLKKSDGTLWFATIDGVAEIDPLRILTNTIKPRVYIEAVHVNKNEWEEETVFYQQEDMKLGPGIKRITLDFTAPSFVNAERVQFKYLLSGLSEEWSLPTRNRSVSYTNLLPGVYTLEVKAANSDGLWGESSRLITFEIVPYFYQTLWFRVCTVFILLLLALGIFKIRILQLKQRQEHLERLVDTKTQDLRMEKERTEEAKAVIENQAAKLRELDRFKTRLFANISHEFRTPLTMIIGPLENAITGFYGDHTDAFQRQLQIMLRNARRLLRLINQLLDLSKLEAGKMELHTAERNVVDFIESVLFSCTPLAEHKSIDLAFKSSHDKLLLYYEPDKLEKVMYNLISNALKFTPEEGHIDVQVHKHDEQSTQFPEGFITITVKDTGKGIAAKDLPHIFDRFRQAEDATNRTLEGSGIGLALVQELVLLHGGIIEANSVFGEGSTFEVKLPLGSSHLKEEQVVAESTPQEVDNSFNSGVIDELAAQSIDFDHEPGALEARDVEWKPDLWKREKSLILVVDDNKDVCEYVSDVLGKQYDIITALNGRIGLEKASKYVPDLVLSDVMMPEMDGTALCKKIKNDKSLRHIPVMLLTAKASIEIKLEGLEGGADDYLAKPFNARELLVRVKNLLRLREQEKELKKLNYGLEQKVAEQMEVILAERQQYEEQLIQEKEKAEASSRLKEVMLDNMNHELRTPLAGILGLADVLMEDVEEPMKEMVVLVKENGDRLLRTLNTIVDLSLIQNGEFKVYQSHVDLYALFG